MQWLLFVPGWQTAYAIYIKQMCKALSNKQYMDQNEEAQMSPRAMQIECLFQAVEAAGLQQMCKCALGLAMYPLQLHCSTE